MDTSEQNLKNPEMTNELSIKKAEREKEKKKDQNNRIELIYIKALYRLYKEMHCWL